MSKRQLQRIHTIYIDINQDGWNNQYAGGRVPNGINNPRLNRS